MDTLCSLYTDVLACICPTKNYALFLLERYLQLKIKAVRAGKPIELKTIVDFVTCCKLYGVKVQRLLCEFYLHNLILENDSETNPSPFVGHIQYHAFISFAVNQLKWLKSYNVFQRQENELDLWVRSEPKNPLQLWARKKNLMTKEGVIQALGPIHKSIVLNGIDYFLSIINQAYIAAKVRWGISNRNVQNREPFNYKNFGLAAYRLVSYSNIILKQGPF